MSSQQERLALAMLVKPLVFVLILAIAYPFKLLVQRKLKNSKWRSILLRRIN
jgi:hypothetical protein